MDKVLNIVLIYLDLMIRIIHRIVWYTKEHLSVSRPYAMSKLLYTRGFFSNPDTSRCKPAF